MDPQGPSQPGMDTAYNTSNNPVSHTRQEQIEVDNKEDNAGVSIDRRSQGDIPVPSNHDNSAIPSSLGYGMRDSSADKGESLGPPASDMDGEQMRAPGEGEVYEKQLHKDGFGEQPDLASDLDRKKEEQSKARNTVKEDRRAEVDVDKVLGDRAVPAAP